MTTDQRLAAYGKEGNDPGLEAMLFQYGRYLLMSAVCCAPRRLSRQALPARQPAGAVERPQQSAVAGGLPHQHQRPDELLARRAGQPERVSPAAVRHGPGPACRRSARHRCQAHRVLRPCLDGRPCGAGPSARRPIHSATWAIVWNMAGNAWYCPALLGALRLHPGQGLSAGRRLSDDEGGLRVLGGSSQGPARRPAGRPQRLVARARSRAWTA